MTTLCIDDLSNEAKARMREAGIIPLVERTMTREQCEVVQVRFDSSIRMADVKAAADSIGCVLERDRAGFVIRKRV